MLRRLQGGCQVPIAGHAVVDGATITLLGLVAELDGTRVIRGTQSGPVADADAIGRALGEVLLAQGARDILARLGPQA